MPGKGIGGEQYRQFPGDGGLLLAQRPGGLLQEMVEQQGDVPRLLPQGRQMHLVGAQPEVEILAELPAACRAARSRWVATTTRACIRRRVVAAEGIVFPLLQQAQQLDLGGRLRSPISSRNRVPSPACSIIPGRAASAPVKAPRTWPNRVSEKILSSRPATLTATSGAPGRLEGMHGAGHQLLAGAAFAGNQQRLAAAGHRLDVAEDGPHPPVGGKDAGKGLGMLQLVGKEPPAHLPVFPLQLEHADGAAHPVEQPFVIHPLDEIIEGALLHAFHRGLHLVHAADDDHRRLRMLGDDLRQQFFSGEMRHGQIEQDQADLLPRGCRGPSRLSWHKSR